MIRREDMLELTRRMNLSRTCFDRIAGCYLDEEGYEDGTFNTVFGGLSVSERTKLLAAAKTIPFAKTNENLKEYAFGPAQNPMLYAVLTGLNKEGLKNDLLMDVVYEQIRKIYRPGREYGIIFWHGCYDIPIKGADKTYMRESVEVYDFLIGGVCPIGKDYEIFPPEWGFLYPSFKDRSADPAHAAVYEKDPSRPHKELTEMLLGKKKSV